MRKDALEVSAPDLPEPADQVLPLTIGIILSATPGIALVLSELWIVVALFDWSIGSLILPGFAGMAIAGAITLGPAVWASWRLTASAIMAERLTGAR